MDEVVRGAVEDVRELFLEGVRVEDAAAECILSGLSGEATTGELELKPNLAAGSLAGNVMNTELGKLKIKKNVTVNGAATTGTPAAHRAAGI